MGEALARSEQNDACTQSLKRDGVVETPSSLQVEDQDKEYPTVHCAHSEESGGQWTNDDVSTFQAARTGLGQVTSCAEVRNMFDTTKRPWNC